MCKATVEQKDWAESLTNYTVSCYEEWTRDGNGDYKPILQLIEHIRTTYFDEELSLGKSLDRLVVSAARHVATPNQLMDSAPSIEVQQLEFEFHFRDVRGRRRPCPFDQGIELFDVQMIRFGIQLSRFDERIFE